MADEHPDNRMSVSIPGVNSPRSEIIINMEKIQDVYNTILEVQSEMNAIFQESSLKLKKAFESIELIAPELNKEDLHSPPLPTIEESTSLRHEPSSQSADSSSETSTRSSSPEPSTSSSNWKLKHQGPGLGLIELMANSGIYVSEDKLTKYNLLKTNMTKYGELLLHLVFSKVALETCSFSIRRRRPHRYAFDDHATNTFVDYVIKHARESGWEVVSRENLLRSLNNKIFDMHPMT